MAKSYTRYVCQECGKTASRLFGRCPSCESWDSMIEELVEAEPSAGSKSYSRGLVGSSKARPLADILGAQEDRVPLQMEEFARVLGGGIVPGSVVLIGGDPGIGKSTLILQMAMELAKDDIVLYVSGEESERQIKMRADRIAHKNDTGDAILPKKLLLVTETNLGSIMQNIAEQKPALLIIDSNHDLAQYVIGCWVHLASARERQPIARNRQNHWLDCVFHRACDQRRRHCWSARA